MCDVTEIFMDKMQSFLPMTREEYCESVKVHGNNPHLIDILSVTMFEIIGNDREILKNAQQYMGPKSIMLQIEADKELGRFQVQTTK